MTDSLRTKSEAEIVNLSVPLRALWYASHGQWTAAHELVQDDPSRDCAWVHAYLHRVEGDIGNARYWYQRAAKPAATQISLDQELNELISALSD